MLSVLLPKEYNGSQHLISDEAQRPKPAEGLHAGFLLNLQCLQSKRNLDILSWLVTIHDHY